MAASFVPMLALLTIVMVTLSNTKSAQTAIMMEPTRMVNNKRDDSNDETNVKETRQVCNGSNITLDWDQSLPTGKQPEVVKWFFTPSNTSKSVIIATFASGILAIVPAYSSRLNHLDLGKFMLSGVTPSDAGTYMAEIIARQKTGSYFTIHRELVVTVADPASNSSNKLTVKLDQHAVLLDNGTTKDGGEPQIQLTCGPLTWRDEPPVDVIWTTPSGSKLNSTYFKNGFYFLRLDNPVEDGVYNCSLDPSAVTDPCPQADDRLLSEASLRVNAIDIRLARLEGEQQSLKEELNRLKGELEEYRSMSSAHVGFFARLSQTIESLVFGSSIKFDCINYNYGEAYDNNTGVFTAPLKGAYNFAFTTIAPHPGNNASCRLNVDGAIVAYAFNQYINYRHMVSGQALVHLNKGSKVWIESNAGGSHYFRWSHFSGFLIHPDWVTPEATRPLAAQQDKDI